MDEKGHCEILTFLQTDTFSAKDLNSIGILNSVHFDTYSQQVLSCSIMNSKVFLLIKKAER